MSKKPYSAFATTMWISQIVTCSKEGLTVGEVLKEVSGLTKSQVARVLDGLASDGYLSIVVLPHGRTGKKVYRPTEAYAMECSHVARTYQENWNS